MPLIQYTDIAFQASTLLVIEQADAIIHEYARQGYSLTLRQLFYQMVARDLIPNTTRSYKRLGRIVADARLAGLIDWEAIIDRTRGLEQLPHWRRPQDIVQTAIRQYRIDLWATQPHRVEVWVEKDAIVGVIERVCDRLRVPYISCRGYISATEIWQAAQRFIDHVEGGQTPIVLHLADHDPSGVDMSRDIRDRLHLLSDGYMDPDWVLRIALNMDQIKQHNPPPNPAKMTDSRSPEYVAQYGRQSWELDALDPVTLSQLIEYHVARHRDDDRWDEAMAIQEEHREVLKRAVQDMPDVEAFS